MTEISLKQYYMQVPDQFNPAKITYTKDCETCCGLLMRVVFFILLHLLNDINPVRFLTLDSKLSKTSVPPSFVY